MDTLADLFVRHGGDKGSVHSYIDVYAEILAPYRASAKRVLEVGVFGGHSLRMWEAYFEQAEVWGVDLSDQPHGGMMDLRPMIAEGTHRIRLFDATSREQIEAHFGGMVFDVIVEDASHALAHQLDIYENLSDKLAPGGLYVIEDVADIDRDRPLFEAIDPERQVTILDRRHLKQRFDDVLVLIRG